MHREQQADADGDRQHHHPGLAEALAAPPADQRRRTKADQQRQGLLD